MGYNSPLNLSRDFFSFWGNGVEFVDEDDAGRIFLSFFKDSSEPFFGFTVELPHDFRAVDGEEVGFRLVSHGLGQKGFATPRKTIEEDALGRLDA